MRTATSSPRLVTNACASLSPSRRLRIEPLEDRRLLTVDPVLTIITHGFQPRNEGLGIEEDGWVAHIRNNIIQILDAYDEQQSTGRQGTEVRKKGPESDFNIGSPPDNKNLTILVDWRSGIINYTSEAAQVSPFLRPSSFDADQLADSIQAFLNSDSEKTWDILLIGHSRGAFFNNEVITRLQELKNNAAESYDPSYRPPGYLEAIMLDPTGVPDRDHPADVVSPIADRVINYNDEMNFPLDLMQDLSLRRDTEPRLNGISNRQVCAEVEAYALGYSNMGWNAWAEANRGGAIKAYLGHTNIHEWWNEAYVFADLREFLGAKDSGGQAETSNDGDGKLPSGGGGLPEDNPSYPDDHANNLGTAATPIRLNTLGVGEAVGSIETPSDHDWFQFRPQTDGSVQIEVLSLDGDLEPYVRFHWDNGVLIRHDTAGGRGARIAYPEAEAGRTYYIDVAGACGTSGSYMVRVTQPDQLATDPADVDVPGRTQTDSYPDSKENAYVVALDSKGSADISGAIETLGDTDWFAFTVRRTGLLSIQVETPYSSLDTHLRLHNEGVLVAQEHSLIERSVTAGERYWLQVRAGSESGTMDIRPGEDPTGPYLLHISQPVEVPGSSGTDESPGSLPGWGGVRGVQINLDANGNGSSRGSIDDPAEFDWFQINGAQEGYMRVTVTGVNDDLKPFVTAFRADGGGIDTDTGEFDHIAEVTFEVAAGERVVVTVSSHDGRYTGGYTIAVTRAASAADDDHPDFGEPPRDFPVLSDEGNGYLPARIERPDDNDWFRIPIPGEAKGYMTVNVTSSNSNLVPFLELNRDGMSGGFFETDDGRDGDAKVTFLPDVGMTEVWAKVSGLDNTRGSYTISVWHGPNKNDDHPDSGGIYAAARRVAEHGYVTIPGELEHPGDNDSFRVVMDYPGPVIVQVISLTEGFAPFLKVSWQETPGQNESDTDGGSGRGGRSFIHIASTAAAPDNAVRFGVSGGGEHPYGDYLIHVWQPLDPDDKDTDTVGIEASPIMLNGAGNGSLPGQPNGTELAPSLDGRGDKDVFQIMAASDRPITFTVSGQDTFLRVYDASGRPLATDHASGAGGASQIMLEAYRGDLYYLEVSAYNGTDEGPYAIQISQETDDHPDVPIFMPRESQVRDATWVDLGPHTVVAGITTPYGVALDLTGGKVYWSEIVNEKIRRANLDGTGIEDLIISLPGIRNIALDVAGGKVYWAQRESGLVRRANLDGSAVETLVVGLTNPTRVALDTARGKLYWTDATEGKIRRANLDGSGVEDVVTGLVAPAFVAIDSVHAKVYWSDDALGVIQRANLDGSAIGTALSGLTTPGDVAVDSDAGKIYWSESGPAKVRRANLDGSDVEEVVSGLGAPYGLSLDLAAGRAYWADYARGRLERCSLNGSGLEHATGEIAAVGDRDVFQITASERGQFTVSVATTDGTLDTFLRVYDSHGNLVAIDDDGGDGRNSVVTFTTFMDEAYQIEVSGYGDNSVGAYELTAEKGPYPRQLFLGSYDDFSDNQLDDTKWRQGASNNSWVQETGGQLRLLAQGSGANNSENSAWLQSRATVAGDIELDFTPGLGTAENSGSIEVTDGSWAIRLQFTPDGSGQITATVHSAGYTELENPGPQTLVAGATHHLSLTQTEAQIALLVDGVLLTRFAGPLRPDSLVQVGVEAARLPLYDDFSDGSIDSARWSSSGSVQETDGRLRLWMYHDGSLCYSSADTRNKPGGQNITGFKLNSDRTAGVVSGGQAECEVAITNGTDRIAIKWVNDKNKFTVIATGYYGNVNQQWDPDAPGQAETPDGPVEIRQNGNNIEILHNNEVKYTFYDKTILPESYFRAEAYGQNGEGGPLNREYEMIIDDVQLFGAETRYAQIALDNVSGLFTLPDDAKLVAHDNFDDNQLDFDKWQIAGTVEERDGQLKSTLFRNYEPVNGYLCTAGVPEGMNLRGFKLNFDRTGEPKGLAGPDTDIRFELTNGTDWIRIYDLEKTTFWIQTGGAYGDHSTSITVPSGEIPDGSFEVRERDGNIEVLHNNVPKLTIQNQTIRAGSYFAFVTVGTSIPEPPQDFVASIDNLQFYVDPDPYDVRVAPSLRMESDTGISDSDHVTNLLSLDFEWLAGPAGTKYQYREGTLNDDASIDYGPWNAVQSETTAHVDLSGASVHVISVRTISPDGIVAEQSGRGFVVDIDPPTASTITPAVGSQLGRGPGEILIVFSETMAQNGNLVLNLEGAGRGSQPATVAGVWMDADTARFTFAPQDWGTGEIQVALDPVGDLAGNSLSGVAFSCSIVPQPPTIASLVADPNPATPPVTVTLTASGVTDSDGVVVGVSFYEETNSVAGLQTGTEGDTLVAIDTTEADGWTASFTILGLSQEAHTYYAQATDDQDWKSPEGVQAASAVLMVVPNESKVVSRRVFYNNSYFDGNNPVANPADDNAIASDKQALLPGGTASFANYTSYSRGINGIMIDFDDLPAGATLTRDDFQFCMGNSNDLGTWALGPAPQGITIRENAGLDGADRVTLIWTDNAIQKKWLQVTVLATANTGLAQNDVFYFGNAIGDSGTGNTSAYAFVTVTDELGARNNPHNFLNRALVDDAYDYNRDSFVTVTDELLARNHGTNFLNALRLITMPSLSPDPTTMIAGAASEPQATSSGMQLVARAKAVQTLQVGLATRLTSDPRLYDVAMSELLRQERSKAVAFPTRLVSWEALDCLIPRRPQSMHRHTIWRLTDWLFARYDG